MSTPRSHRPYPGPIRAVVHDWAGTVVDFGSRAPATVFVELFRRHDVTVTEEQAREPMGRHKRDHIRALAAMAPLARQWERVHGRPFAEADAEALYAEFIPLQMGELGAHAGLIPGALEALQALRQRGIAIGSSTGYTRQMMEIVLAESARQGYVPDACVCADEVAAGRPAPWLAFRNAERLGVYPMAAIVKVGDTVADVEEGLNAGMWSIGVTRTGNEVGLGEAEVAALEPERLDALLDRARQRLLSAGAHYVVESIADVPALLPAIEERLRAGEMP